MLGKNLKGVVVLGHCVASSCYKVVDLGLHMHYRFKVLTCGKICHGDPKYVCVCNHVCKQPQGMCILNAYLLVVATLGFAWYCMCI